MDLDSKVNIFTGTMVDTDTSLGIEDLADPDKLKPASRIIKMDKIDEDSDDSDNSDFRKHINSSRKISAHSDSSSSVSMGNNFRRRSRASSSSSSSSSSSKTSRRSKRSSSSETSKRSHRSHRSHHHPSSPRSVASRSPKRREEPEPYIEKIPVIPTYKTDKEIRFRKIQLVALCNQLKKNRELTQTCNLRSTIEDLEFEVNAHAEIDARIEGIETGKGILLKGIKGAEWANTKWDPFGIKMKGFHGQMERNIVGYEPLIGELYDKYKDKFNMIGPELKLAYGVGFSLATYHHTQQLLEEYGLEEVAKKNPELVATAQANLAAMGEKFVTQPSKPKATKEAPTISNKELYMQMQREKEEQARKGRAQDDEDDDDDDDDDNEIIQKMMNNVPQHQGGQNVSSNRVKQSGGINGMLDRARNNANNGNVFNFDDSTSAFVSKTVKAEDSSACDSENVSSFNPMKQRKQRPKVF
jgi:hypothetical protein